MKKQLVEVRGHKGQILKIYPCNEQTLSTCDGDSEFVVVDYIVELYIDKFTDITLGNVTLDEIRPLYE